MSLPVCEDTISRKWVLNEIITKVEDDVSLTDEQKGPLSAAKYIIRHAPPVEPKRPRGEWIDMSDGGRIKYIWYEKYMCPECGERGTNAWSFCPVCGADMRGEK